MIDQLVAAELIGVLYWPAKWVRNLGADLNRAFQANADGTALAFYKDQIAYTRALRHIANRIPSPAGEYVHDSLVVCGPSESVMARAESIREFGINDPRYDRVFWAVIQAALAVFILTGTTLRQIPEDPEPTFFSFDDWQLPYEPSGKYDEELKTTR